MTLEPTLVGVATPIPPPPPVARYLSAAELVSLPWSEVLTRLGLDPVEFFNEPEYL